MSRYRRKQHLFDLATTGEYEGAFRFFTDVLDGTAALSVPSQKAMTGGAGRGKERGLPSVRPVVNRAVI